MKKSIAILFTIGALIAIFAEMSPAHNNIFTPEAQSNPSLAVEFIKNDSTGWAIAQIGMIAGGFIIATGAGLFAKEVTLISDKQTTQITGYLGAAGVIIGVLAFAYMRYLTISQPAEEYLNDFNVPGGIWEIYTLATRFGILLLGFVMIKSGYSKKLGWVLTILVGLFLILMGADGPPGMNTAVFLIMGITLLFKRSKANQDNSQTG